MLPENSNVKLDVFNSKGQKVRTLLNNRLENGHHQVTWDGTDDNGRTIGSGIYLYRIQTDKHTSISKMIMMK